MIDEKDIAKWILLKKKGEEIGFGVGAEEKEEEEKIEEKRKSEKESESMLEIGKALSELKERIEALSSLEEKRTSEILQKEDRLLLGEERIEKKVDESYDELTQIEERLKEIEKYYEELKEKSKPEHKGLIKSIGEKIARIKDLIFRKRIERAEKELVAREELGKPGFVSKAEKERPVEEGIKPMIKHRLLLPPPAPPMGLKKEGEKEPPLLPLPPLPPKKKKKGLFRKIFGR